MGKKHKIVRLEMETLHIILLWMLAFTSFCGATNSVTVLEIVHSACTFLVLLPRKNNCKVKHHSEVLLELSASAHLSKCL